MSYSRYEPLGPAPGASTVPASRNRAALLAGTALLGLAVAASVMSQRLIDHFLAQLDSDALQTARQVFERTLEDERAQALSQVSVLAEDTRIRSTAMMANLDEATMRDVLKDLMATSGAGLMAVLDVNGKVRAVTGVEGLRDVDLGSSTVVKAALQRPSAYIWTFPQQVLAVGVAPIRTQDQVNAFLVMGFEAAKTTLSAIHGSLSVSAAVLLGDKLVVSGTDDAGALDAIRSGAGNEGDKDLVVSGGDQPFFTRTSRVIESVANAKVVWAIPQHHEAQRIYPLKLAIWTPSLAAALILALTMVVSRRDGKAS
jgi:Double sensory domain of two-component sensor kinase